MKNSITSWDGALSFNEFSITAYFFADKWRTHNSALPPWSWVHHKTPNFASSHHQVIGYLSLERFCLFDSSKNEMCGNGGDEISFLQKVEDVDDATLVRSNDHQVHYYDFHIVYSDSYRVPVLYFRAYSDDGQPLALNEIEKDLPAASIKVMLETKWTFITQEEHPYLNRPWYKLHPCATCEWMKLLFLGDNLLAQTGRVIEPYLVSWFSVVGQVVGLRVPIEMVNDHSIIDDSDLEKNQFSKE